VRAIRDSGGTAVTVSNEEVLRARTELREREGLLVEFSPALSFAAAQELSPDECVVALITSSGLKDPESMNGYGEVPLAEPTLESLVRVLDEAYQFAP
jgi:threonine synthase